MPNAIALFKKYVDMLDEVYKLASCSSVLDGDMTLVRMGANANEIIIPKMTMDGMADHSRNGEIVKGNVSLTMETKQFNYARSRRFEIDQMDNEETAGIAFGKLAAEFVRTKATPEQDAFRFATYCGISGILKAAPASLADGNAVLAALLTAQNAMDEAEVPVDGRILFITPTNYNAVTAVDTTKSKEVLNSFSLVQKVPQTRFYTAIDLLDGTTENEEEGGYQKAAAGKDINFLVAHKTAVMQYNKHAISDVILPQYNNTGDGYIVKFRRYGLAEVYENKVAGIYLHNKA